MRGTLVDTGNIDPRVVFSYATGVTPDREVNQYLYNQHTSFIDNIHKYNKDYAYRLDDLFKEQLRNNLVEKANSVITRSEVLVNNDNISRPDRISNANYMTRIHVMSYPELYEMYRTNSCNAYDDDFVDTEPNVSAEYRDSYLIPKSGVGVIEDDGMVIETYHSDVDDNMSIDEKIVITDLWDEVAMYLSEGYDPTSKNEDKF